VFVPNVSSGVELSGGNRARKVTRSEWRGGPFGTVESRRVCGTKPQARDDGMRKNLFRNAVLFVLRAQDAVDGVGGAVAGFVKVTNLHLAEKADGEQV
jgi:hypothetical protein